MRRRAKELGRSDAEIARRAGISARRYSNYVNDKREPDYDLLLKICTALDATPNYVFGIEDAPPASLHVGTTPDQPPVVDDLDDIVGIPEKNVRLAAGAGAENDESEVINVHYFSETTIRHELNARPEDCEIVRVEGDSMEPKLRTDDRLMIDTNKRIPSPPGIFALFDGLGVIVKRLEHIHGSEPPTVRIISENSKHEPYERTLEEAHIIGRVIWRAHKL